VRLLARPLQTHTMGYLRFSGPGLMAEGIGRMGYGEDRGGAISFVRIDREKEASVGQGMPVTIIK
jgi:hypothetical protein